MMVKTTKGAVKQRKSAILKVVHVDSDGIFSLAICILAFNWDDGKKEGVNISVVLHIVKYHISRNDDGKKGETMSRRECDEVHL